MSNRYSVELPSIQQNASPRMLWFKIDGSEVASTSTTAGLLSGIRAATIKAASEVITLTLNEGLQSTPLGMSFFPVSANPVVVSDVTLATTGVIFSHKKSTDDSALTDIDGLLIIYYLEGPDII